MFPPNNIFENPSESLMDFDYMDELLFDGCWLQATDGSEFINSNNNPLYDPSFQWPTLEFGDHLPENVQEERQRSSFLTNLSVSQTDEGIPSKSHIGNSIEFYNQSENYRIESSDTGRRWWIPPTAGIGRHSLSVKERLIYAIDNIKHSTLHKNVLIQIWLPENREGKKVLSTSHQLSSLDYDCPQLSNYRNISETYHFAAEGDSKEVGLPGRVFMGKVPEWTPDVRFFKTEEYPRVEHAQQYDVRGSIAVPIFDHDRQSCLGVIEVVMTTQKSNYAPEIEGVCKALEAVDLRSSEPLKSQKFEGTDGLYQAALPEILEIVKSACETHNLPLAQTWVPCIQQGKGGCRHSAANVIHCISTVDSACYVNDPAFKDFQEACSEHHLLKGQGVVGRAFTTNQPCYFPDITSYTKTEYPLSHHARIFDLCGVVAIRLRSTYTGNIDYVLEFFLPVDCKEQEEQKGLLNSLSIIIQNVCRSLRIVTDKELLEEGLVVSELEAVKIEEISPETTPVDLIGTQVRESGSGDGGFGNDGGNRRPPERRRGGAKTEKTITLEMLRQYFAGSLKDAAKNLGVCPTTLKRICRQHGIQRWPSRKIKKVGHSLQKIQLVMDSVHGASGSFQIGSFYSNFPKLASPDPKTSSFSASKLHTIDSKPIEGVVKSSLSPSCSQTSSSGQSCSSGTHPYPHPHTPTGEDSRNCGLKRARSDAEIHVSLCSQDQEPKVLQRSHSHKSLTELPVTPKLPPKGENVQRVKVTFGEEKVRFRLQKDWGYSHLLQEIAKRFGITDMNEFHLKYFDDDSEWVLLTCDADLEECIDVYRSCENATIKLALFEPQLISGSLGSTMVL